MAALFAYLLSITVFVGAGYAGLVWLAEPPPAKPSATSIVASAHPRPKVKPEVAAADDASPRESATSSSDAAASAPNAAAQQPPAGVAAVSEAKPEQPAQEARQPAGQDRKDDNDAADRADETTPLPTLRSGRNVAAATEHEQPGRGREPSPLLPKPVLSPKAANAVAQWFGAVAAEKHAKPTPHEPMARARQHRVREASRSRYVMMTLRTIDYPDGRREQLLLPLRQFRAASD